jgi:hypothetical protein
MLMKGHSADDIPYDVRYEPYFESTTLLFFVLQFKKMVRGVGDYLKGCKWG